MVPAWFARFGLGSFRWMKDPGFNGLGEGNMFQWAFGVV